MSAEMITHALFLITAALTAPVLNAAQSRVIFPMAGTFSSAGRAPGFL
ncbi:MAG: hypothetical protein WB986_08235 [Methanoregula sp.]